MAQPYLSELQEVLADINVGDTELVCKHFFSGAAAREARLRPISGQRATQQK